MKTLISSFSLLASTAVGPGCAESVAEMPSPINQNCAGESVLIAYQNKQAVVTMTQKGTYCLIVDSTAIATRSYKLDQYLVPTTALPLQYQVEGQRVVFTGRKKSCYGLTTLPELRSSFGYKLEIDAIQAVSK